jgi:hypothetical protein
MVMAGMIFPLWVLQKVVFTVGDWDWLGGLILWVMALGFLVVHALAVLSLATSDGQETLGTRAVMLFWASLLMIAVTSWVIEVMVPYLF